MSLINKIINELRVKYLLRRHYFFIQTVLVSMVIIKSMFLVWYMEIYSVIIHPHIRKSLISFNCILENFWKTLCELRNAFSIERY